MHGKRRRRATYALATMAADAHRGDRLWERWRNLAWAVSWTPPTSTEVGIVLKSGLAAGLSWLVAESVTDVPAPVLAPLTAIVVVQVSVRASIMSALQRSAAVVLGVLLAIAIGDALGLNALTVAAVVVASLGFAELVLRLPRPAARQVPISALVVLAALSVSADDDRLVARPRHGDRRCRRRGRVVRVAGVPARRRSPDARPPRHEHRRVLGPWAAAYARSGRSNRPRTGVGGRARHGSASCVRRPRPSAT